MAKVSSNRFGHSSSKDFEDIMQQPKPQNTQKNRKCVWSSFQQFCLDRDYEFTPETPIQQIATILEDWGLNMRKSDGTEYKEYTVKTMWNVTAKMVQEKYFNEFHIDFNPFCDQEFKRARDARNAKRKQLQLIPEKRKISAVPLNSDEYQVMIDLCDENTPEGLQIKFFLIVSPELAWRGADGAKCLVHHFQQEIGNNGQPTGRIAYNEAFAKSLRGVQMLNDTRWLVPNETITSNCPVRLLKLLLGKRTANITTDRFFITPNPSYQKTNIWYKNFPVGKNEITTWTRVYAKKAGLDTTRQRISNHSITNIQEHAIDESMWEYTRGDGSGKTLFILPKPKKIKILPCIKPVIIPRKPIPIVAGPTSHASVSNNTTQSRFSNLPTSETAPQISKTETSIIPKVEPDSSLIPEDNKCTNPGEVEPESQFESIIVKEEISISPDETEDESPPLEENVFTSKEMEAVIKHRLQLIEQNKQLVVENKQLKNSLYKCQQKIKALEAIVQQRAVRRREF